MQELVHRLQQGGGLEGLEQEGVLRAGGHGGAAGFLRAEAADEQDADVGPDEAQQAGEGIAAAVRHVHVGDDEGDLGLLGGEEVDDIDALLADFDKPTPAAEPEVESDLGAEIAAELDAELDELGVEVTDDIDALLADFDKPAEPEAVPVLGAEIAAELDAELVELGVDVRAAV